MLRTILWNLFLFALPILLLFGWLLLIKRVGINEIRRRTLAWAAAVGFILMFAGLLLLGQKTGFDPAADYIAPQIKDGKLVPGYFKDRDAD